MDKQAALVFFPHNPYPPKSGAHTRCLSILQGLIGCGMEVHLASSAVTSETRWTAESVDALRALGVREVHVHIAAAPASAPSRALHARVLRRLRRLVPTFSLVSQETSPLYWRVEGLASWFAKVAQAIRPRVVLVNYAYFGYLRPRLRSPHLLVIDTHDIVSLNRAMQRAVTCRLGNAEGVIETFDPAVLEEAFYDRLELKPAPCEFEIYDRFDRVIAISPCDDAILRAHNLRARVVTVGAAVPIPDEVTTPTEGAILVTGPNQFNLQGALYYTHRVAPLIQAEMPEFVLTLTGNSVCSRLPDCTGVNKVGFVPDLSSLYRQARFAVCPTFGGTGQQFKILEAMAHGLPAVALRGTKNDAAIVHGVNGFLASDAADFARCCVRLARDAELAIGMGKVARRTIAEGFTQERVVQGLTEVLGGAL